MPFSSRLASETPQFMLHFSSTSGGRLCRSPSKVYSVGVLCQMLRQRSEILEEMIEDQPAIAIAIAQLGQYRRPILGVI